MKTISIIHPTISARADALERILAFYEARTPGYRLQFINVLDRPSWPAGYNAGYPEASGDYIFIGSDDIEPIEGWADAMVGALERHQLPASRVWDHTFGIPEPCGYVPVGDPVHQRADGKPGQVAPFSRAPAFTRELAEQVGPWPEIAYYADNWVSDKCRLLGWQPVVTAGYDFVHHWDQRGRLDTVPGGHRAYLGEYNKARAALGLGPSSG